MALMDLLYTNETLPYNNVGSLLVPDFGDNWGSTHPNFMRVLSHVVKDKDPAEFIQIVEVGSWLGRAAVHMAEIMFKLGYFNFEIVCVDTWLGSLEMWTDRTDPTRYGKLKLINGYPSIYRQWLSNVWQMREHITPMPMPSLMAAKFFQHHKLQADVVYLDASHDHDDVLADLWAWYPLTRDILFGDDLYTFIDVNHALDDFKVESGVDYKEVEGRQWVIQKSQSS